MVEGDRITLTDHEGRRYIDGLSGVFAVSLGHGNEEIIDAIAAQHRRLSFSSPIMTTTDRALELAAELIRLTGGRYDVVKQLSSGSEATEAALKMARQFHRQSGSPERYKTISFYRSYHGATMGALTQTGWPQLRTPYEPFLTGGLHAHAPIPGACRACSGSCTLGCLAQLRDVIEHEGAAHRLGDHRRAGDADRRRARALRRVPARAARALRRDRGAARLRRDRHRLRPARLLVRRRAGRRLAGHPLRRQGALRAATRRSRPSCSARRSAGRSGAMPPTALQYQAGHTFAGNPVSAACGLAVIRYFEEHGVLENVRLPRRRARGPAARDRGSLPDRRRAARARAALLPRLRRPGDGRAALGRPARRDRRAAGGPAARPARPRLAAQRDPRAAARS